MMAMDGPQSVPKFSREVNTVVSEHLSTPSSECDSRYQTRYPRSLLFSVITFITPIEFAIWEIYLIITVMDESIVQRFQIFIALASAETETTEHHLDAAVRKSDVNLVVIGIPKRYSHKRCYNNVRYMYT